MFIPVALGLALAGGVYAWTRRRKVDLAGARRLAPYVRAHLTERWGLYDPVIVGAFRQAVGLPPGGWDGAAAGALLALDPAAPLVPPLPLGRNPPTPVIPYEIRE